LAEKNHYPAIDIPASLSRVMQKVVSEDHLMYSGFIRELITTYNSNEELIRLSAYVKGSDSKVDMAISKKDAIDEFLRQRIETKSSFEEAKKILTDIFLNSQEEEY
jgi:flagellum-specific ATP synthase